MHLSQSPIVGEDEARWVGLRGVVAHTRDLDLGMLPGGKLGSDLPDQPVERVLIGGGSRPRGAPPASTASSSPSVQYRCVIGASSLLSLARHLLVGVHSGGVQTDRTMYGPVAGRRSEGRSDPAGSQRRASWFHDCIRGGPGDSARLLLQLPCAGGASRPRRFGNQSIQEGSPRSERPK